MTQMPIHNVNLLHRTKAGFTLIELVVAMAVAVIIMGIIVVGLSQALGGGERRATQTTLETARSILGDFNADSQNRNRFFRQILKSPTGFGGTVSIASPGDVSTGAAGRTGTVMNSSRRVFTLLLSSNSSKSLLNSLSSNVVERDSAAAVSGLLDAWNNPILLVPDGYENETGSTEGSGGLTGVTRLGATGQTIRSSDRKPFFASAGPDGNFTTGDDNLYSFEN
jgi:prepilin-type N-terminal cleavage/methylation domain-containing protein